MAGKFVYRKQIYRIYIFLYTVENYEMYKRIEYNSNAGHFKSF